MILSDTLHYRPDGTVSGITRITRETYTTPSGREATEDVSSTVQLSDVTALLDGGYAAFDAHNKSLEAQIVTERETAASEKEQALREIAAAHAEAIAAKEAEKEEAVARVASEKDAALSRVASERDAALAAAEARTVEAVKQ